MSAPLRNFKLRRPQLKPIFTEIETAPLDMAAPNPIEWRLANLLRSNNSLFVLNEDQNSSKFSLKKSISGPSVNMRIINSTVRAEQPGPQNSKSYANEGEKPHPQTSVTSQTLYNEANRELLVGQLKKKAGDVHVSYKEMKNLAADVIRSFKCLSGFKHQNVVAVSDFDDIFLNHLESVEIPEKKAFSVEEHSEYDDNLKKKYAELLLGIKERKDIIEDLREKIKDNLQLVSEKRAENKTLLDSVGVKEAHLNHQRQLGRISATEVYSMLSEFKRKVELESYKIDQIFKSCSHEIQKNQTSIRFLEDELVGLNFNRLLFRIKLKEHFLEFFRNEEKIIKSGKSISFFINQVMSLKEQIPDSAYSKFFDAEDIKFCKEYTELLNLVESERQVYHSKLHKLREGLITSARELLTESTEDIIGEAKNVLRMMKTQKVDPNRDFFRSTRKQLSQKDRETLAKHEVGKLAGRLRTLKEKQIDRILTKGKAIMVKQGAGIGNSFMKKSVGIFFGPGEAHNLFNKLLQSNNILQIVAEINDFVLI